MACYLRFLLNFVTFFFLASSGEAQNRDVNQEVIVAMMKSKIGREFLFSFEVKANEVFLFLEPENRCFYFFKLKEFKKLLAGWNIQDPRVVFAKNHNQICDDGQEIEVKYQGLIKNFCQNGPQVKHLHAFKSEMKKSLIQTNCLTEKK